MRLHVVKWSAVWRAESREAKMFKEQSDFKRNVT